MSAGPVPIPTPETQTFWDGTAIGELRIQRCNSCEEYYFYPRPYCPGCQSDDVEWRVVSGKGTLASYNINYRPFPIFESKDPQVIALVELDEGVRMMSTSSTGIAPGTRVTVTVAAQPDGSLAPLASPA